MMRSKRNNSKEIEMRTFSKHISPNQSERRVQSVRKSRTPWHTKTWKKVKNNYHDVRRLLRDYLCRISGTYCQRTPKAYETQIDEIMGRVGNLPEETKNHEKDEYESHIFGGKTRKRK